MPILLVLVLLVSAASGMECQKHRPSNVNVPKCPKGALLTEDYPVMAAVVSDADGGVEFIKSFSEKIYKAGQEPPPQLVVNATSENFNALKKHLQNQSWFKKEWLASLTRVNTDNRWNWSQDYFETFYDPATGYPIIREVKHYGRAGDLASAVGNAVKQCGIITGSELPALDNRPGFYGGNLEAGPGNLCLVGDDHLTEDEWGNYSLAVCNKRDDTVKAPVSWLTVGHTDEIYKMVPTNGKEPCNFAIMLASPRKGLELLKADPDAPAFNGLAGQKHLDKNFTQVNALRRICQNYKDFERHPQTKPVNKQQPGQSWNFQLISRAYADPSRNKGKPCSAMTNSEFLNAVEMDPELKEFNQLVQKEIDDFKLVLKQNMKERLPHCDPEVIDIPDLYFGRIVEENGIRRPAMASANSILPSPSNSVVINGTVLYSNPLNKTFENYLSETSRRLGLKSDFIDTLFAHARKGNLHCSSQMIRYCRPEGN